MAVSFLRSAGMGGDRVGNSQKRAKTIKLTKGSGHFSDRIGGKDTNDYFKFSVSDRSRASVSAKGSKGAVNLQIFDGQGKVTSTPIRRSLKTKSIDAMVLNSGTYYIRIFSTGKGSIDTKYKLQVSVQLDRPIDPTTGTEYKPDQLLVKFKASLTQAERLKLAQDFGADLENLTTSGQSADALAQWNLLKFKSGTDLKKVQAKLAQTPGMESNQLDYLLNTNATPSDAQFGSLWGLNNTGQFAGGVADGDIDALEAWDLQKGSEAVTVAVLDTGVDYTHPDLARNMWKNSGEVPGNRIDDDGNGYIDDVNGYDFVDQDSDPMDRIDIQSGHGTHVAGTIGAVGDNSIGIVGVSPKVRLMPLRFIGAKGGTISDEVKAIDYAIRMGAKVINASYGNYGFTQIQQDAIERANRANVLFVAAAGNDRTNTDIQAHFPSNIDLPNLISVAATTLTEQLASFSNYGVQTVDLGAPGDGILSTLPGNQYGYKGGTSMAAPHVSGAAALLLAQNSSLTPAQLKNILMSTGDAIPALQGKTVSGKRLNIYNAIRSAIPNTAPVIPVNNGILVRRGELKTINGLQLRTSDAQQNAGQLTYTVTNLPQDGKLFLNGVAIGNGSAFTQADVDGDRLSYKNSDDLITLFDATQEGYPYSSQMMNQLSASGADIVFSVGNQDTQKYDLWHHNVKTGINTKLASNAGDYDDNGFGYPENASRLMAKGNGIIAWDKKVFLVADTVKTLTSNATQIYTNSGNPSLDRATGKVYVVGNNVTWSEGSGSAEEVFFYNRSTDTTTQLTGNSSTDSLAGVMGDRIIWTSTGGSDGGSDTEVFSYNTVTGVKTQLTQDSVSPQNLKLSEAYLFWTNPGTSGIYRSDGISTQLLNNTTNINNKLIQAASGGNVVWTENVGTSSTVYFYNGITGAKQVVTTDSSALQVKLVGSNVLFGRLLNGASSETDLSVFEGTTGTITPIAGLSSALINKVGGFDGESIVWESQRPWNGNLEDSLGQIFRYDVATRSTTQLSSGSPTGNNFIASTNEIYGGTLVEKTSNGFSGNSVLWINEGVYKWQFLDEKVGRVITLDTAVINDGFLFDSNVALMSKAQVWYYRSDLSDRFSFTVSDGEGGVSQGTFNISLN
jgi:subtilisin family serine protease